MGFNAVILMDTCAIIWDALDKSKLSAKAKRVIKQADDDHTLFMCDISIWELAMLIKRGRLEINESASNFINLFLQSRNIEVLAITPEIADLSVNFNSSINNDPADRLIAACSVIKKLPIITADNNLRNSELLDTIW
jgi:PIN domain nuclease of toxin-antitoxin system